MAARVSGVVPAPAHRSALARIAPTAVVQHGVFTAAQARAVGLSRGALDRRVRAGELVSVDHRVYRSALTPGSWHQRLAAACLAAPAVACHRSAAALWQLAGVERRTVEVAALRHRRRKAPDVVWHESYLLGPRDVTLVDGIPVTRPARTVVDLAAVTGTDDLLRAFDDAVRRRLTTVAQVACTLERLGPRRPGVARMREALAWRTGARPGDAARIPESDLETMFENLLHRAGLPSPTRQHPVPIASGRILRIDFAYPRLRVGIELAGARYHAVPDRWLADMARLTVLGAMGWQMLTFGWTEVRDTPDVTVQAVRHALERAGAGAGH
ncbi:MAG: hypothetical protein AMXMBFR46_03930 [Acidimicrobiia bacterium]